MLTTQPVVTVRDSAGNTVANSAVAVTIALPSGSNGTLGGTLTVNASSGVVTYSGVTLAGLVGTNYVLGFSSTGLTAASANAVTVTPGDPSKVTITTQPVAGASAVPLTQQPVVEIQDLEGNKTSSTASVTVAIFSGSGGAITGTTTVNAVDGVATFTNLVMTGIGSQQYVLRFQSGSLTPAQSNPIEVTMKVVSITRVGSSPSSNNPLVWKILFTGALSGVSPTNFSLTGSPGATITGVTGSGAEWFVSVDPGTAVQSVGLSMVNGTGITNSANLQLVNLPFTTGDSITVAPRIVSMVQKSPNPVTVNSGGTADVTYDVTYNENVTGLAVGSFELVGTSAGQSSILSLTGSGTAYTVTVRVGGTGRVALKMNNSTGVQDSDSNPVGNLAFTSEFYAVPPRLLSMTRLDLNPAGVETVRYTVTFNESVTGLTLGNFQLLTTGTSGAVLVGLSGSGTTWTVTVNLGLTSGTVALRMANSSGLSDSDGLTVETAMPFTGEVYQVAPRILSLVRAGAAMTAMGYAEWLVTFNEPVTGLTSSNFAIPSGFTPKTPGQTVSFASINGAGSAVWKVRLNIPKGEGVIGLNLTAGAGIIDADGLTVQSVSVPITGESVIAISVEAETTNERVTTRRRRGLIREGSDNLAKVQQTPNERIGNGDLFMRTFTATNSGSTAIPSITLRVRMPQGVRVIPWEYSCNRPGPCTITSTRPDRDVLTTPTGTPAVGEGRAALIQEIRWTGSLAANQSITVTVYVQMSNEALSGETNLADIQLVDSMDMTVAAFVDNQARTMSYLPMAPGGLTAGLGALSGQRPASLLIYPLYTSSVNLSRQDTRFTLTNASPDLISYVHLFFVDGSNCSVADMFVTLTASQTISFLASDLDPTVTGYLIALAVDDYGFPQHFNYLLGSAYVKFESGHSANLPAVGVAALAGGTRPVMSFESDTTMDLYLDGISYSEVPRVLALSNIPSRADGNQTMLVVSRVGGNLAGGGGSALSALYGLLFDDRENAGSYTMAGGSCQMRAMIDNATVRTVPRFNTLVPAGRTGWMKITSVNDEGIVGAMINYNPNGFNQGHLLHVLTTTRSTVIKVPLVPPMVS
ncbi:MAG: hypothetical protein EBU88_03995 [Acidobacteria bacterium]|nr:hypothetical protein [Acidobacteriota bacterium]